MLSAGTQHSRSAGALVALGLLAAITALIFGLREIAPVESLGVVYLLPVLVVSAYWGLWPGLLTSVLAAAAYNFFHIPPTGEFTIAESENVVALVTFVVVAAVTSTIAELARSRAQEAERRQAEADLLAGLAGDLLSGERPAGSPEEVAREIADGDEETYERLLPSVRVLIAYGIERDARQADRVESEGLRRSDDLKTALLRSVSHDLRSPLTAILTAGHALGSPSLTAEERTELSASVTGEGERLARVIDKLLDLSRLQAGRADPHLESVSLEEVVLVALEGLDIDDRVELAFSPDLPSVRADPAQLERAFANLLENAARHSGDEKVSVRAHTTEQRVVVRVVDRGPGIPSAERERIFEPFQGGDGEGSGLGLAIVKGFVEANGGSIWVQSLPGQGTSFALSFPAEARVEVPSE